MIVGAALSISAWMPVQSVQPIGVEHDRAISQFENLLHEP